MDKNDDFTFYQSDLPSISFCLFQSMRRNDQLCDVKINVKNFSLRAHRLVLAAVIPYFRDAFISKNAETKDNEIFMDDLNPGAVEALIDFAYTNKVSISLENIEPLMVASVFLQLNQVTDACFKFMSKCLQVANITQTRSSRLCVTDSNLAQNSDSVRRNFEAFVESDQFLSLPASQVKEILSADDLNVSNEEIVFEALLKWVKNSLFDRKDLLPELLKEVRLIFLPLEFLFDRVDREELVAYSTTCMNLMNGVKAYHLLPKKRSKLSYLNTYPRNAFKRHNLCAICSTGPSTCSVYLLDVVKSVWHNLADKEVSFQEINAVALNGRIYMFLDDMLHTFDVRTYEWKTLDINCEESDGAAMVAYEHFIYVFGSNGIFLRNTLRLFDTLKNQWLTEVIMKTERCDSAATLLEDSVYITGGYDGETSTNAVEKYRPSSGEFNDVAPMLTPRGEHGCTSLNGNIFVCGGTTNTNYRLNTAELYDPRTGQWKCICSMKNSHCFFSLVSYKNKLYALDDNGAEVFNDENYLWEYELEVPLGIEFALSVPSIKD